MRAWWIPALVLLAACSDDDDNTGPGVTPETPTTLSSTSLDGAIALVWSDNPFQSDPDIFGNYRVYSTTYDIDVDQCGDQWTVEGTTVAPEFLVGALANGVPRCFSVTAVSVDGLESDRSPLRGDTPRPDSRNVALAAAPTTPNGSGFRFWDDLNADGSTQSGELGIVRSANAPDIDFFVDRDGNGDLFLTPVRAGTGVEFYDENDPVEDLTSIDFADDLTYRHHRDPGAARVRLRVRDRRRRRVRALRRGSHSARGHDVPDHGLGVSDRSRESGAAGLGR